MKTSEDLSKEELLEKIAVELRDIFQTNRTHEES